MKYNCSCLPINIPSKKAGLFILFFFILIFQNWTYADSKLSDLAKKVSPAVVIMQTFDENQNPIGQGSGFFINYNGELITNWHVIEDAYTATVRLTTGETYFVEGLLAMDGDYDIVKLKVKTSGKLVPSIKPIDDLPSVGDDIIVVGNPLGLESTLSKGIVSAVRTLPEVGKVLQISAPISSGSSGSPVLDMKGQVIGVAFYTFTEGQAINFAIPSKVILNLSSENEVIKLSDIQLFLSDKVLSSEGLLSSKVKASENPCLKFLPNDWWILGNFNCKAYFALINELDEDSPQSAIMTQYVEMIKGMSGIDISSEVQYMSFIISGNPDLDPRFLIMIKGRFDNSISEMRLKLALGADMQRLEYKGTRIYQDNDYGYCFPEESTLIFGSTNILQNSIDVLSQRTKLLPDSLHRILERTNGASIIWLAFKPNIILNMDGIREEKQNYPDIFKRISDIEYASLFFEQTTGGFLASAIFYLPESKNSKELYDYLEERKKNLLNMEGSNVFMCSFLMLSNIILDGNYVRWDTHFTLDSLLKLWSTKVLLKSQ